MSEQIKSILQQIEKYYPKNISTADDRYFSSPEFANLQTAREHAKLNNKAWLSLMADIKESFPSLLVEDWSYLLNDAAYIVRLYFPEKVPGSNISRALVVCVSIITPSYLIYYSEQEKKDDRFIPSKIKYQSDEHTAETWTRLSVMIKKMFENHSLLNSEVAHQKVNGMSVGNMDIGAATIKDFVFTDNIW